MLGAAITRASPQSTYSHDLSATAESEHTEMTVLRKDSDVLGLTSMDRATSSLIAPDVPLTSRSPSPVAIANPSQYYRDVDYEGDIV